MAGTTKTLQTILGSNGQPPKSQLAKKSANTYNQMTKRLWLMSLQVDFLEVVRYSRYHILVLWLIS